MVQHLILQEWEYKSIATIVSAAMMLRYSLNETKTADMIEDAIKAVLKDGYRTKDLAAYDAKEV